MKKKKKENKEKKLFLNKETLRLSRASVAEALGDTQAELEMQSAIPSAGKESGKESADRAKLKATVH